MAQRIFIFVTNDIQKNNTPRATGNKIENRFFGFLGPLTQVSCTGIIQMLKCNNVYYLNMQSLLVISTSHSWPNFLCNDLFSFHENHFYYVPCSTLVLIHAVTLFEDHDLNSVALVRITLTSTGVLSCEQMGWVTGAHCVRRVFSSHWHIRRTPSGTLLQCHC